MPVWHEKTKPLVDAGKIHVLGIVQEQHPQRARLFMQWKQMDWPVLVDAFNVLEVSAVPIAVLVDADGIVRHVPARLSDLEPWLEKSAEPTEVTPATVAQSDSMAATDSTDSQTIDDAVQALDALATQSPLARFQSGVAYRKRYDSTHRRDGDFERAVTRWNAALQADPNQYIWRRRIQQYGPKLDKPYPFYAWTKQATEEIKARGEIPYQIIVPLTDSELATPSADSATPVPLCTDAERQVQRDVTQLVRCRSVVVPDTTGKPVVRIHLTLTANADLGVHWNEEAGPIKVGLNAAAPAHATLPKAGGDGERTIEIELRADETLPDEIAFELFYHVCYGPEEICSYLRQPISVSLNR